MRYNEVTGHQTSLGGTSINAWETWARRRGQGSPPSFSSLLILSIAYGRGPLGTAEEKVPPGDLVAEAYERLPIGDQLSLKNFAVSSDAFPNAGRSQARQEKLSQGLDSGEPLSGGASQIGDEFSLSVPTIEYGNSEICVFSLPNPQPGQLLDLAWHTFGFGVERLCRQIKNLGRRLDADICFGVNEAGLVMATFLASARFSRCAIGYLRCNKIQDGIDLDSDSYFPTAKESPTIIICDFEVKHADVIGYLTRQVRSRYPKAELYFAVFGAMTKAADLRVASFDDLTGAQIMRKADFSAVFIAARFARAWWKRRYLASTEKMVDPLDTSELAVRGLHGYTHVMVYSRSLARPIVAVVGDIFHHVQLYIGARDDQGVDRAYVVTADSVEHTLNRPSPKALSQALVTNYLMRPDERFIPLTRQQVFIKALSASSGEGKARGRIGVDFGSVGLCHVAAGFSDAMIEFAKGFAIWDLSPGHYILHAAGGIVTDLLGTPIPLDY